MSVMRVRFITEGFPGAPGVGTFYFTGASSPIVQADATEASARVRAFYAVLFGSGGIYPATMNGHLDPLVQVLDEEDGSLVGAFAASDTSNLGGTGSFALMAGAVGPLLQYATSGIVAGRSVRGRTFLGPTVGINESDGTLSPIARTFISAAADNHLDVTISTFVQQVIWSRPTPSRLGSLHDVTGYSVADDFAVLRSRRL